MINSLTSDPHMSDVLIARRGAGAGIMALFDFPRFTPAPFLHLLSLRTPGPPPLPGGCAAPAHCRGAAATAGARCAAARPLPLLFCLARLPRLPGPCSLGGRHRSPPAPDSRPRQRRSKSPGGPALPDPPRRTQAGRRAHSAEPRLRAGRGKGKKNRIE